MLHKLPFEIVSACKRSFLVRLSNGEFAFCSNKCLAVLLNDPEAKFKIIERPEHVGCRTLPNGETVPVEFPATKWIAVAVYTTF